VAQKLGEIGMTAEAKTAEHRANTRMRLLIGSLVKRLHYGFTPEDALAIMSHYQVPQGVQARVIDGTATLADYLENRKDDSMRLFVGAILALVAQEERSEEALKLMQIRGVPEHVQQRVFSGTATVY
jgi:hypothetical protein